MATMRERPGKAFAVIALAAALAGSRLLAAPIILYPISPSLPAVPYIRTIDAVEVGAIVAFPMPDVARRYQRQRGQELPADFLFMKPIAAGPGDHVCNSAKYGLTVNGVWRARTIAVDRDGRTPPVWNACRRLSDLEYFMLSDYVPNSFDSRFFGPILHADILATYRPLYIATIRDLHLKFFEKRLSSIYSTSSYPNRSATRVVN